MKKLSDDEKAKLRAKIEQARTERIQLITESFSDSPVSSDVEGPTAITSTDERITYYEDGQADATNWVAYCVTYTISMLLFAAIGFWPLLSGVIIGLIFLVIWGWMNRWRKQSWEGVVVGKYYYIWKSKGLSGRTYWVEVCHNQTVQLRRFSHERWKSIEIGDYVVKKSGSDSTQKRAIQEEEARDAIHVLIEWRLHPKKRPFRPGGSSEEIRSRAVEALSDFR